MSCDDASCSDCNLEIIERQWTQLMLDWMNRCVSPQNKKHHLALRNLVEIIDRYKGDVCADELDYALLASDEVESFIKYKYPMLRLINLAEAKHYPKQLYIMTAILLYHCCADFREGVIDLCTKLEKIEQHLILRFCGNLSEMETTINNVDLAIQKAYENVSKGNLPCKSSIQSSNEDIDRNNDEPTDPANVEEPETYPDSVEAVKSPNMKFKSSITVMLSGVIHSVYSISDSSDRCKNVSDVEIYVEQCSSEPSTPGQVRSRCMSNSMDDTIAPCRDINCIKSAMQNQIEKFNERWRIPVSHTISDRKEGGKFI